VTGCCEHDYEHSGSIKDGEFLDLLSGYWRLKKDSAQWSLLVASPYSRLNSLSTLCKSVSC